MLVVFPEAAAGRPTAVLLSEVVVRWELPAADQAVAEGMSEAAAS
jgi:hypothetical protein